MKRLSELFVTACFIFCALYGISQERCVYKTIDTLALSMEIYTPEQVSRLEKYPAIVFFFGGGWVTGDIAQFKPHATYFSGRGMVSVLVDYRVSSRNKSTPFESLEDAKSAIRFLRANAERFHIDPDRIVASGGSAGGQLAAAATSEKYNDKNDDLSISARPNALVLFNPVIDNGPGGYGYDRIGEEYLYFSPLHNLRKGRAPPTILFLGTKDEAIPVEAVQYYKKVMEKIGSRCDLHLYEGQTHGFFNFKWTEYYKQTVLKADEFLVSIGFLKGSPTIQNQGSSILIHRRKILNQ